MNAVSRSVCATTSFVWWLTSVFSRSCCGLDEVGSGHDVNMSVSNSTVIFEILPGLYGVIAASGLIFAVVITLVCCTMILVHGKILPQKDNVTLHKLRQHEETDMTHNTDISLHLHRKIEPLSATSATPQEEKHNLTSPDNDLLISRQTTV